MNNFKRSLLIVLVWGVCPLGVFAQQPNLSGNWIRNGGTTSFEEWHLTEEGQRRLDAYDFKTDDPALDCIAASWTRVWLNPNVVVQITQGEEHRSTSL